MPTENGNNNFFTELLRLIVATDLAITQFERDGKGFKFQVLETEAFDFVVDATTVGVNEKDFGKASMDLFPGNSLHTAEVASKAVAEFVRRVIFVRGICAVDSEDLLKHSAEHLANIYAMSRAPEPVAPPKTKVVLPAAIRN